jgi:hypothetical protein
MTDLVDFVHARLDDDEAAAYDIARNDPARALADVEAKRRIVAEHARMAPRYCRTCDYAGEQDGRRYGCTTLRLLALPHAGHPDYQEEWRP